MPDSPRDPFDLSRVSVGLARTGEAHQLERSDGPPPNVDGLTVGTGIMTKNPPHGGETHPDGDELLYLITGSVEVVLEEPDGNRIVELQAGQAFLVPRGVWHRVLLREPSHLLYVTPGPNSERRPASSEADRTSLGLTGT